MNDDKPSAIEDEWLKTYNLALVSMLDKLTANAQGKQPIDTGHTE